MFVVADVTSGLYGRTPVQHVGGFSFWGELVCVVQRVVMPVTGAESWTVLGDDGAVVAPAERYLAYLSALERSPNTVRAYAVSLRLWFEFLGRAGTGWAEAGPEDVARFVAWLRAPADNVTADRPHVYASARLGRPSSFAAIDAPTAAPVRRLAVVTGRSPQGRARPVGTVAFQPAPIRSQEDGSLATSPPGSCG